MGQLQKKKKKKKSRAWHFIRFSIQIQGLLLQKLYKAMAINNNDEIYFLSKEIEIFI